MATATVKTTIKPLSDRVVLRRVEAPTTTPGGLVIPDAAKDKPTEAVVLAVGPGKVLDTGARREPSVAVGDRVLVGRYSGTEIRVDGEDVVITREDEIFAVLGGE